MRIARQINREHITGEDEMYDRATTLIWALGLPEQQEAAVETLLNPHDGIWLDHLGYDRWRLSYMNGRKRTHTMLEAGVRRTVVVRWLAAPGKCVGRARLLPSFRRLVPRPVPHRPAARRRVDRGSPRPQRDSGGYGAAGSMGHAQGVSVARRSPKRARHTITDESTRPVTAPRSAAGTHRAGTTPAGSRAWPDSFTCPRSR